MKSLLQLLAEEDRAAKELMSRREGFENIKKSGASEVMISEFKKIVEDGEKRLEKAKDELREYIAQMLSRNQWWDVENPKPDKIEPFMQMIAEMVRESRLLRKCEEWDMNEAELVRCMDYLENILGVSL